MISPQSAYAIQTITLIIVWYKVWKSLPKLARIFTAPIIPVAVWVWNFQLRKDFRKLGID